MELNEIKHSARHKKNIFTLCFILQVPSFNFTGVGCILLEKLTKISMIAELHINQKTPKSCKLLDKIQVICITRYTVVGFGFSVPGYQEQEVPQSKSQQRPLFYWVVPHSRCVFYPACWLPREDPIRARGPQH